MKKLLSFIAVFILFATININATTTKVSNKSEYLVQSCFSFYHGFFYEFYGGINIDNVADFNYLVAECQATFEQ